MYQSDIWMLTNKLPLQQSLRCTVNVVLSALLPTPNHHSFLKIPASQSLFTLAELPAFPRKPRLWVGASLLSFLGTEWAHPLLLWRKYSPSPAQGSLRGLSHCLPTLLLWELLSINLSPLLHSHHHLCTIRRAPSSEDTTCLQPRLTLPLALSSLPIKKVKVKSLSRVRLLVTPRTAAFQAPPSMGFSRQGYWSGVPFLSLPINIFVFLLCSEKASQTQFSPEAFALMPPCPPWPNFPKRGLRTRRLHLLHFPPPPSGASLPLFCSDYSVSSVTTA